jgi:enediyne biosynthesis protein E4
VTPRPHLPSRPRRLTAGLSTGVLLLAAACGPEPSPETPAPATSPRVAFVDRASQAGLDFVHDNGMSGRFYIAEVTAGGCGLLDYDGDGDLDVYLVQGGSLGPPEDGTAPEPARDRLYRNDLTTGPDGEPLLSFTDVTETSGLRAEHYGMGVAVGDYDGDGDRDLYVTNLGPNQLWRNDGDGTFTDVTAAAGAGDDRWSVPATFFDADGDGDLDLFVGNYLDFTWRNHKTCLSVTGAVDYCGPSAYRPLPDRLLRNRGDGTFTDATADAGLQAAYGPALGNVATDLDGDGRLDLYVANDGEPNQMWIRQPDGTFIDRSLLAGTAVNADGVPEASMGVLAADFDGDSRDDLFMTHITGETHTFYRNQGEALFRDSSIATGLSAPSKAMTGFGTAALDFDNDGRLDIFVANGAVRTIEEQARRKLPYPLAQPDQLFRNVSGEGAASGARFEDVSAAQGEALSRPAVSRGVAVGDVDNDGDPDLLVLDSNGPVRLLLDQVGQDAPWLGIRLVDGATADALGARAGLLLTDGGSLWRRVAADGSFASANDPRLLFGLGGLGATAEAVKDRLEAVEVRWSDGARERFPAPPPGRYTTLRRGSGESRELPESQEPSP